MRLNMVNLVKFQFFSWRSTFDIDGNGDIGLKDFRICQEMSGDLRICQEMSGAKKRDATAWVVSTACFATEDVSNPSQSEPQARPCLTSGSFRQSNDQPETHESHIGYCKLIRTFFEFRSLPVQATVCSMLT